MSRSITGFTAAHRLVAQARLAVSSLRDLGLATAAGVLGDTARQEWARLAARPRRRQEAAVPATAPGALRSVEEDPEGHGAWIRFANMDLEVRFLAPDVTRLSWGPAELPAEGLVQEPTWDAPGVAVTKARSFANQDWVTLAACGMSVSVSESGAIRVADAQGRALRVEDPPLRRGATWTQRTWLRSGERIHGLGEQAAPLDLRGTRHRLFNRDPGGAYGPGQDPTYCGIPVYLGVHRDGSYLVFYECTYEAHFSFGSLAEASFAGGMLRSYVVAGSPQHALERFTDLVGRAPLPPRWALGYHQCRWGYKTEADVREVVSGFRERNLPLAAIHLDIDYMDGYRVFTVDKARFPDLAALGADLRAGGTRVVTIVDCGVKVDGGYDVFTEGRDGGHLCRLPGGRLATGVVWPGRCAFPDVTDPECRRWWAGLYGRLLDAGVDGIWHDMNEPTAMTLWGDRTLPLEARHVLEGRGGDHAEGHNVYGLLVNRAGYEGLIAARPGRRPWILSRSGWAGVQRYAWNWTGDVESSWEAMRQQIATVLGLGLSGVPYSGADIGGFSGSPDPEMYLRWLQMSIAFPLCRTHSAIGLRPREPWRFASEVEERICELIRLRQQLVPYLYTLAYEASQTGHPLVRPVFWVDEAARESAAGAAHRVGDERALGRVCDAYFCGDALLVAPVLAPGERARRVLLPAGRFYELHLDRSGEAWGYIAEGSVHEGDGEVHLDAPLSRLPVLVRGGSIIPLGTAASVDDDGREPVTLHCYLDAQGAASGSLYRDAGDGYGPGRLDSFELRQSGPGRWELRWRREEVTHPAGRGEQVDGRRPGPFEPPHRGVRLAVHGIPGGGIVRNAIPVAAIEAPVPAVDGMVTLAGPVDAAILETSLRS